MKKKKVAGKAMPKMRNRFGGANIIFIILSIIVYSLTFFYWSIESVLSNIGIMIGLSWILAFPRFPDPMEILRLFICPYTMRTYLWIGGQNILVMVLGLIGWQCKTHVSLAMYFLLLIGMNVVGFPWVARIIVPKQSS